MTKRITKMTPEQEARLERGMSTEPMDRERVQKAIAGMYQEMGKPPPETVLYLQSPLQGWRRIVD